MYLKRDCSIVLDLSMNSFCGWQYCVMTINGETHKYWFSYACGDLFGRFLNIVYGLYTEANDSWRPQEIEYETNDPNCLDLITAIIGKTTWDSEGGQLDWTFSRVLDNNEDNIVKVTLDYDFGERVYNYDIKLDDLLYATARAVTILLKQTGICGYHFSSEYDYLNMTNFLMIKHFALTGKRLNMKQVNIGSGTAFSSLDEEIGLLLFDM